MTKKILLAGGFFLFLTCSFVSADAIESSFQINIDHETIKKGYTVDAFSSKIKLSLLPNLLSLSTKVEVYNLSKEPIATSSIYEKISDVYQFEFINKHAYDNHKPFYIQLDYEKTDNRRKGVFYFDKNKNNWLPLPTQDYPNQNIVRSLIHLPFARIAVFAYPNTLAVGKTSWYNHKKGYFAASPDFPIGSKIRVKNLANNKFIDVIVNDFGPDRSVHPDRVIDLDKIAFEKISPLEAGVINVIVEPLYIAPKGGKVLGVTIAVNNAATSKTKPTTQENISLKVKSAIAVNEKTGEIIWQKNSDATLPLASLTKLVSMKIFLDTKPNFKKVVSYAKQDEKYNYAYVDHEWEVARLKVSDGETMTIEDLFYSALVGSANNAVESLVRVSGLSRDEFIDRMNEYAAKIGAKSTHFIEPTGLSPENVSSVSDYAIITKEVLKNTNIKRASSISDYEFYTIDTNEYHHLRNTNSLIAGKKYNITGSKTGYLHEAGYCLMTRVNSKNNSIIVITFGAANRATSFAETEKLIKYSLNNINY